MKVKGVTLLRLGYLITLFQLLRLHSIEEDGKIIMNGEQVKILNKVVITYLKAISQNLSGSLSKTMKDHLSQDKQ